VPKTEVQKIADNLAASARRLQAIVAQAQARADQKTERADAAGAAGREEKRARAEAALLPAIQALEAGMPALTALCEEHRPVFERLEKLDRAVLSKMPVRVADRTCIVQVVEDAAYITRTAVSQAQAAVASGRNAIEAAGRTDDQSLRRLLRHCAVDLESAANLADGIRQHAKHVASALDPNFGG
jgi:hypothetical protein